jgi:hypothetical protein
MDFYHFEHALPLRYSLSSAKQRVSPFGMCKFDEYSVKSQLNYGATQAVRFSYALGEFYIKIMQVQNTMIQTERFVKRDDIRNVAIIAYPFLQGFWVGFPVCPMALVPLPKQCQ